MWIVESLEVEGQKLPTATAVSAVLVLVAVALAWHVKIYLLKQVFQT